MYAIIYTSLIVLYIASVFAKTVVLDYAVGVFSVAALLVSLFKARGTYRLMGALFLLSGVLLFLFNGVPLHEFVLQFRSMLGLLSVFLVLPFINSLIYIGQFDKTIRQLLQNKMTRWDQLYGRSSIATHLLANFLNIATIPFLFKSLQASLKNFPSTEKGAFCSRSLLRSYALALTWSPVEVNVSSTIDLTGASFLSIFPLMLLLAVLVVSVDIKLSGIRYRKIAFIQTESRAQTHPRFIRPKILQLALFLLLLIILVSAVQFLSHQSFLFSVVLVIPFYSLIWSQVLKKKQRYLALIMGKWKSHAVGLSNYFFLFLSAGLFVKMVSMTGGMLFLRNFYLSAVDIPLYFYLLTAAFFLVTSLIGFHPLVALTFFGAIIEPMVHQLAPIPISVVLIASCLSTAMYSPYNLSTTMLANYLNINSYKIAVWNLGFALCYLLTGIGFAFVLQLLLR